jgi:UDP-N-acetylglucosamine 1-carboxyvinyltransferase
MDKFIIRGGNRLEGSVPIAGAKNASLALMPATILGGGKCTLHNTPRLRDITTMSILLEQMGVVVRHPGTTLELDTTNITSYEAPYDLVKKMRASFYVLGPLLAKFGYAKVSYPGGCAWGPRPVNLHLMAMEKLGADITIEEGYVVAKATKLKGAHINFDMSSVGATGNALMAAVLAEGKTTIDNAAIEPEITQLAHYLHSMGAQISGIGTSTLIIEGVKDLKPADDENIPDRIEAGTFLAAVAGIGGKVTLTKTSPIHMSSLLNKLEEAGCNISHDDSSISIESDGQLSPVNISTAIYPGFPTDMQAQWMTIMANASGTSVITDTIYHDRFNHVPELQRLGANIEINKNTAIISGVSQLVGAKVMSTDLRASASLIIAGLMAKGTTEVLRVYHIDRGYESIELKLRDLGADIQRIDSDDY